MTCCTFFKTNESSINGFFILDTNIYRNFVQGLDHAGILLKADEIREKENKLGYKSFCSIIVASELISHLAPNDPAKEHCYKALYLLNHHTKNLDSGSRLIAYPFENVLTKYFLKRNFKHYSDYKGVIQLMSLLSDRYDISQCDSYIQSINEIVNNRKLFREQVKNQGDKLLKEKGLSWNSFTAPVLRVNKVAKRINYLRLTEYRQGISFYKLATLLINEVYLDTCKIWPLTPRRAKMKEYLEVFQAPLQLYHLLLRKIGEAPTMEDALSDKWNTINDMHLLFNLCDKTFPNTILVTNDELVLECGITYGLTGRIGRLADYNNFINQSS